MDRWLTRQRLTLDAGVRRLFEDASGIGVEAAIRLRPGREVDVEAGALMPARPALVWTWRLVRVGHDGPVYRGFCRWTPDGGAPATRLGEGPVSQAEGGVV